MNRTVRNYIIRIAVIAVLTAGLIIVANALRPSWAESSEQRADQEIVQEQDLLLWYYDDALTPYVEQLKADYFRKTGLRIASELVSVVSFFEDINEKNVGKEGAPDIYITDTTRLEQAYLGSVAKQNAYPDIYSLRNYSVKALTSVRYGDRMVAYPLCFDMAYFAYNRNSMTSVPKTFAGLAKASGEFVKNADSPVDMVFLDDVSDLLFNYQFIGGVVDLGGAAGDDDSEIVIPEQEVLSALGVYRDFSQKVNISRATTDYDLAENSFVYGRSMSAILKCSSISVMNREGTPYEICEMPAVNATIPSKALSYTWCVCVNPMSSHVNDAEELAKFMTYENTDSIYGLTGYMSCRRMDYKEPGFDQVYMMYDDTVSLPKFIETEELWRDAKVMFNNIWDGGEPAEAYTVFTNSLQSMLATRTKQERK